MKSEATSLSGDVASAGHHWFPWRCLHPAGWEVGGLEGWENVNSVLFLLLRGRGYLAGSHARALTTGQGSRGPLPITSSFKCLPCVQPCAGGYADDHFSSSHRHQSPTLQIEVQFHSFIQLILSTYCESGGKTRAMYLQS